MCGATLGLDQPLLVQYGRFLWGLLHLDLGKSLVNGVDVAATMLRHLPYTIMLTIAATLIGIVIGIPAGVASAMRPGGGTDHSTRLVSLFGSALPDFYVGLLLLTIFGLKLGWFPLLGGGDSPFDLRYLALPAVTLGLLKGFGLMRLTRTAVIDVAGRDYVRTPGRWAWTSAPSSGSTSSATRWYRSRRSCRCRSSRLSAAPSPSSSSSTGQASGSFWSAR